MNTQLQAFYNVEKPQDEADWTLRFQLQVLLPKYAGENRRYRQGAEE